MPFPAADTPFTGKIVHITPFGPHSSCQAGFVGNAPSTAVYISANRAVCFPFRLSSPAIITLGFVMNGTSVSGNIDIGIYDPSGTRIVSKGTTPQAGTSAIQTLDLTDTLLGAGLYYGAFAMDNITGHVFRTAPSTVLMKTLGFAQVAASFVLPATMTLATVTSGYLPYFGFSGRTVV